MNCEEKILNIMAKNESLFSEFIACFINKGLSTLICNYSNDRTFFFRRTNSALGLDEIFLYCENDNYAMKVLDDNADVHTIYMLPSRTVSNFSRYNMVWNISVRKQFSRFKASCNRSISVRKLSISDEKIVAKSTSEISKQNYQMAMNFGEDCYAIVDDGKLISFLSVAKLHNPKIAEITWIYTEVEYRKKGFATSLLSAVSNILFHEGYLATYHCAESNVASAHTALKANFATEKDIIVLKKQLL